MTIKFKCSTCRSPLLAPDEAAGRKAKCRQCGGAVQVPNPEADRWPPGMAPRPVRPAAPPAKVQTPRPASPLAAIAGAVPTAQVVSPQSQPAQASKSQPPVKVAIAVPVASASATNKHKPPPLAVPAAPPPDDFAPPPTAVPVENDSGPSPLDEIAAMLDFEKSAPKTPSAIPPHINPYASPSAQSVDSNRAPVPPGQLQVRPALQDAWRLFRANFSDCVAAVVCAGMSVAIAFGITAMLIRVYEVIAQGTVLVFGVVLFWPILIFVPAWIGAGMCKLAMDAVQQGDVSIPTIYAGRPYLLPTLIVVLVQALFIALSSVTTLMLYPEWLGLPVLLPGVLFWHAPFLAIDRNLGVIAALIESVRLTVTNFPRLALIWLIALAATIPIVLITFGLGLIFVAPFWLVLHAMTYAYMTARP